MATCLPLDMRVQTAAVAADVLRRQVEELAPAVGRADLLVLMRQLSKALTEIQDRTVTEPHEGAVAAAARPVGGNVVQFPVHRRGSVTRSPEAPFPAA